MLVGMLDYNYLPLLLIDEEVDANMSIILSRRASTVRRSDSSSGAASVGEPF